MGISANPWSPIGGLGWAAAARQLQLLATTGMSSAGQHERHRGDNGLWMTSVGEGGMPASARARPQRNMHC